MEHLITKRIAIIGAGPAGLAAAKYILAERAFSDVMIFEQQGTVGGLWNYTPIPDNALGVTPPSPQGALAATFNTPMYEGLETNLPHSIMQFSDFPFPPGSQLFPPAETVRRYLQQYADELVPLLRLKHQVLDVRRVYLNGRTEPHGMWKISVKVLEADLVLEHEVDAIVVATGHQYVPCLPDVDGISTWKERYPGTISHSKFYRTPVPYQNKKVLVVGNSASGLDIGRQIATVCQKPLTVAQKRVSSFHTDADYAKEYPALIGLNPDDRAIRFADGRCERDIDAILLCTGYHYSYPFLSSITPPIITDGQRPHHLYKHIFHIQHPTLTFLGIPEKTVPFPVAESQAAVVARVLSGRLTLPSAIDMVHWEENVVKERGDGKEFSALQPPIDIDYMDAMHDWAQEARQSESACGKKPPRWGATERWVRLRIPEMKKAFDGLGEQRRNVISMEDLGFKYDE